MNCSKEPIRSYRSVMSALNHRWDAQRQRF